MGQPQESIHLAYEQTCDWYHKIDDFRAKLLGFLPFISGAGIFLLLKNDAPASLTNSARAVLALLGFVITIGLLFYELRGFQRCIRLSKVGEALECAMKVYGPFTLWPRSFGGFVNEPVAAAIIYPAVLAAWIHVATLCSPMKESSWISYLVVGLAGVIGFFLRYRRDPDFVKDESEKAARRGTSAPNKRLQGTRGTAASRFAGRSLRARP